MTSFGLNSNKGGKQDWTFFEKRLQRKWRLNPYMIHTKEIDINHYDETERQKVCNLDKSRKNHRYRRAPPIYSEKLYQYTNLENSFKN